MGLQVIIIFIINLSVDDCFDYIFKKLENSGICQFPRASVLSSNCLFCFANSPTLIEIQSTMIQIQILTGE